MAKSYMTSTLLFLACSIVNQAAHYFNGGKLLERPILNLLGLLLISLIAYDSNQLKSAVDGEVDSDEAKSSRKEEIQSAYHTMDKIMSVSLVIALIFGAKLTSTAFFVQAILIYADFFVIRRINVLKRGKHLIKCLQAVILPLVFIKKEYFDESSASSEKLSSVLVSSVAVVFYALFILQSGILCILENRKLVILPEIKSCYLDPMTFEESVKYIEQHEVLFFAASWGWNLLVTFPALLASWTSSAYIRNHSSLNFKSIIYAESIFFLASSVLLTIFTLSSPSKRAFRKIAKIIAELLIFVTWIMHLILQKNEFFIGVYSAVCLGCLCLLYQTEKLYDIADKVDKQKCPIVPGKLVFTGLIGRALNPLINAWIKISAFITALIIFVITARYNPQSWYKMVVVLWIGIIPSKFTGISYSLITFFTLIELMVKPLLHSNIQGDLFNEDISLNFVVLFLSELQRLRFSSGIYRPKEELHEESKEESKYSLVRLMHNLINSLSSLSTFILMGLLLFTPQMAAVNYFTSIYTLWTGLFLYLFYDPEKTGRLRVWAIRILALISASFYLYDWTNLKVDKNSEAIETYLKIHAAVFWLSCSSVFGHTLSRKKSEEQKESTDMTQNVNSNEEQKLGEFRIFLQRLFVLFWTRLCALLAFVSAFWNPCVLGVGHLLIGCLLVGVSVLSPELYIPMIIWLEVSIFAPAILPKLVAGGKFEIISKFVVGESSVFKTTILTAWALILFLQPLFIRLLEKHATKEDRIHFLVSFRLLPADDEEVSLQTGNIESFENSFKYYFSQWFVEFHDEIMNAALVTASIGKTGFLSLFYACLAILQVSSSNAAYVKGIAHLSLVLQVLVLITRYILISLDVNHIVRAENLMPKDWVIFFDLSSQERSKNAIWNGSLIALFIFLTIRWYLTRTYCYGTGITRRFDTHWCRLCGEVSKRSQHGYSRIKQSIHLYLGFASHLALFFTSILAFDHPTIPTAFLMLLSLLYFFNGETALLSPILRNQVNTALVVIFAWTLLKALNTLGSLVLQNYQESVYIVSLGLSNESAFPSFWSKLSLGLSVFLLTLQSRLFASKAFPFVIARLYHSIVSSSKRSKIFFSSLRAVINFQQRNLKKAMDHVKAQLASFTGIDISDWKKLCYVPPQTTLDERTTAEDEKLPEFGQEVNNATEESLDEPDESTNQAIRKRNTDGYREHLSMLNVKAFSDAGVDDINAMPALSEASESVQTTQPEGKNAVLELESNFYLYTFVFCCKLLVKFLLSCASDYRRILQRPSNHATMRIIFRGNSWIYRVKCIFELLLDLFHANFDLVLDILVMDAHMFHSSGFSTTLVFMILLIGQLQRPFSAKSVNNYMMIATCVWIFVSYFTVIFRGNTSWINYLINGNTMRISASHLMHTVETAQRFAEVFNKHVLSRFFGLHQLTELVYVIMRPTIILLALSYKRSIMRHLGLWSYSTGLRMARVYYQSEEDLVDDELSQIDVNETDEISDNESTILSVTTVESNLASLDDSLVESDTLSDAENKEELQPKSWLEIFSPRVLMPWKDYYVLMFSADFACMLIAFYYWGDFMLGPGSNRNSRILTDMLNNNLIPRSLVNMLVLNTVMLLVDRALYVSKNYTGKLIMHYATIILFHWYIFFNLPLNYPRSGGSEMYSLYGVRLWYAFKWIYWIASGLQLRYTYPPLRTEVFLSSSYNIISVNLRNIVKNIPFIEELRTIVDWSVTPSALGVWPWLKLADIYDRLYAVQCGRAFQRCYYGRHAFGQKLNQFSKYIQGIIFMIIFVIILWSPFLVLSHSSVTEPNEIDSVNISFAVKGYGPVFASFTSTDLSAVNDVEYGVLKNSEGVNAIELDKTFFTKVKFPRYSQIKNSSSKLNEESMLKHLKDASNPAILSITWSINRKKFQDVPNVTGSVEVDMDASTREILAEMLSDCRNDSRELTALDLHKIIPGLVEAPLKSNSRPMNVDLSTAPMLVKHCPVAKGKTKSSLRSVVVKNLKNIDNLKTSATQRDYFSLDGSTGGRNFEFFVYSTKIAKYNFSSFNLIGLYVTVVFAVAQFLRMMHSDMTTRIPLDELPNPMPLLNMYRQILMVREMGDYESEEAIYWQLIEILRNPKLLIEMTKINH